MAWHSDWINDPSETVSANDSKSPIFASDHRDKSADLSVKLLSGFDDSDR